MKKLKHGKDVQELAMTIIQILMPYRVHTKKITTGNGSEFCAHKLIAKGLETTAYFTDIYSSWQKGVVE